MLLRTHYTYLAINRNGWHVKNVRQTHWQEKTLSIVSLSLEEIDNLIIHCVHKHGCTEIKCLSLLYYHAFPLNAQESGENRRKRTFILSYENDGISEVILQWQIQYLIMD